MSERSALPWFPFYFGDYLRTTVGWPIAARAAYVELLAIQWDRGALPVESDDLRALVAGATAAQWSAAWPLLDREFPIENARENEQKISRKNAALEVLREKQTATRRSRSQAASLAARARWRDRVGVGPDPAKDA